MNSAFIEEITFIVRTIVIILLYQQISGNKVKFYYYILLPVLFRILFIVASPIGYFSFLLFWLVYSLYKNQYHNRILDVFYGFYPIIIESLFNRVLAFFILPILGVSISTVNNSVAISLMIELSIFPLFYYLTRFIRIDFGNLQLGFKNKYLDNYLLFVDTTMVLYFIILQVLMIFSKKIPNAIECRKDLVGIYVVMFLMILIYLNSIFSDKLKLEVQEQKDMQLRDLKTYNKQVESLYEEIRNFKHDYVNIITSIKAGLELKDIDAIQKVYDDVLSKTVTQFSDKKYDIANLTKMDNMAIKGMLSAKLTEAHNKDIQISVEIEKNVDMSPIDTLDTVVILSILLDNAIEAAILSSVPTISLAIFNHIGSVLIVIENTMKEEKINNTIIFSEGYSTKGDNRGIGLFKVTEILDKYPNISINTKSNLYRFEQIIKIKSRF